MADPRAFVSVDFDHDETEKILFVGQAKNSKTPFSIQDWSAKSSMPQAQWDSNRQRENKQVQHAYCLGG